VRRLQVTASVVPSSPILVTLMKEALRSSKTSVLKRATRLNIPEDAILHSHRRENVKSYRPHDIRGIVNCKRPRLAECMAMVQYYGMHASVVFT
jgi:hypothetical protein